MSFLDTSFKSLYRRSHRVIRLFEVEECLIQEYRPEQGLLETQAPFLHLVYVLPLDLHC